MRRISVFFIILITFFINLPCVNVCAGDTIIISRDGYSKEFSKDKSITIKEYSGFSQVLISNGGEFRAIQDTIYAFYGSYTLLFFGGDYNFIEHTSSDAPLQDSQEKYKYNISSDVCYSNDPVLLAAGAKRLDECPYVQSPEINLVSENPIVGFSWDDVDSFKKYGANGDCYSFLVSDRGVSPFYQGSWNDRYEIRLSIDYFVASHDYADKVFQAFESCNFEFNDLFYDKVSELYSSGYFVGEAEITKEFVLHPYNDKGWYKDTKFLPGLSSFFSGISPITDSAATEIHKLQLSNYFFHPHFVRAYVYDKQSSSYGATTVYEYDKDGNFLSVFSYDDYQNQNQFASGLSGSYLEQITELRQQVEDLQKRNEQLVNVNRDTLGLAGEIVQGDIATNTYKVANNMTEMIPIVGTISMLISMAMLWLPKECLVVISFSVIAIAIISIYKALRG